MKTKQSSEEQCQERRKFYHSEVVKREREVKEKLKRITSIEEVDEEEDYGN